MPKISVVIPAYNSMKYLPETLESVLQQTFNNFEVLIINDGSTDKIIQWASEITDLRVKLISQKNQGVSVARNAGIGNARGEYIAFLDADDLWHETKLEKQVRCLDENPEVGLVHTSMAFMDCHGKLTGRIITSRAEGEVWQELVESNKIACSSVMVRRCCLEKVGGFEPNLHFAEDWDLWIRISVHYPFAVVQEPLYYYRQIPNSLSKNLAVLEQSFNFVIEKAFRDVPQELLYLKNRSYAYAYLCLGWKALQSSDKDCKRAIQFSRSSLVYYPQLRYSREYIRLSLAIRALQLFGNNGYDKLLELVYAWRRKILNLTDIRGSKIFDKITRSV